MGSAPHRGIGRHIKITDIFREEVPVGRQSGGNRDQGTCGNGNHLNPKRIRHACIPCLSLIICLSHTHACVLSLSLSLSLSLKHTCILVDLEVLREGKVERKQWRILERRMERQVERRRYKCEETSGRGESKGGEQRSRKLGPFAH